ncbi:MAG: hypothetical protein HQL49_09450 [Gammaproteobacteria bacterium]|nr:hypothetical protein [Gammaproteobacteria bacterium]
MAAANSFSFALLNGVSAVSLLARAEERICSSGGRFSGDATAGSFSGKTLLGEVAGEYQVVANEVIITITGKPALLSLNKVKTGIEAFFSA